MSTLKKPLDEQVIVITGASSGIGLATARSAAEQGAKLVLAAREELGLADIARELEADGGNAAYVSADVGHRDEVEHIADVAIERFGGFDTWVNNAGVSIWGRLDEVSDEDHRRLFETNFWGAVYGSLVAVEHLRHRGGTLINIGSVASDIALPLQGMYSASKHALRGFTDALRMELKRENAPVSVTLIKPTSINTPLPQHARNYTEYEPQLAPPLYPPEEVANAILHAATHEERDIYVGGTSRVMSAFGRRAPRTYDWIGANVLAEQQLRDELPRNPEGNLYRSGSEGAVRGEQPGYVCKTSLYTRATLRPLVTMAAGGLAIAAAGAAAAWITRANRRHA